MNSEVMPAGDGALMQRLLTITHEILQAQELLPALQSIALAVSELFGFKYVTIVAADAPSGDLYRRVLLGFPQATIDERLGEHITRDELKALLLPELEVLPYCYYSPAEREVFWPRSIYLGFRPLNETRSSPDAWHERDALTLVLPDRDNQMVGYLSADGPFDGKVPSIETLRRMQLFVNLVGLALANARSHQSEVERRRVLEENARLQNEFFGMVSHEVRSPLASIRGTTSLLETHFETLGPDRRAELLNVLQSSTTRLSSIFEDFLLLSRMDAGHLSLRPQSVSPRAVLDESIGRIRSEHVGREIVAHYGEPIPDIVADEGRLVQVLTNLLSNAMKYSFPQTVVHADVSFDADFVRIAVSNEGPGIGSNDRDKIFTRFGRLSYDDGSTGLGLYICRQLMAMMNGSIGFESEPKVRTTFWVLLPRA